MNTKEKYGSIVNELHKRTLSRSLAWQSGGNSRSVQAEVGGFIVFLSEIPRNNSSPDYVVTLYNSIGEEKDKFSDPDLVDLRPADNVHVTYFEIMQDLFRRASRAASGADEAIDGLLNALGVASE